MEPPKVDTKKPAAKPAPAPMTVGKPKPLIDDDFGDILLDKPAEKNKTTVPPTDPKSTAQAAKPKDMPKPATNIDDLDEFVSSCSHQGLRNKGC